MFNVPLDEVTKEQRSHAKTVNFGIIYGVSAFGLSNHTNLSRKESADLIEAYYKTYPRLKSFIQEQVDFARENGYVETISGRRRYLKDINSANAIVRGGAERNAVNAPIQGSAADIIKIAMINIHKKLTSENWKSKMLLQVHDELVFDVHNSELEKIQPMIKHEMENAFKMAVPLDVEIGLGKNWLKADSAAMEREMISLCDEGSYEQALNQGNEFLGLHAGSIPKRDEAMISLLMARISLIVGETERAEVFLKETGNIQEKIQDPIINCLLDNAYATLYPLDIFVINFLHQGKHALHYNAHHHSLSLWIKPYSIFQVFVYPNQDVILLIEWRKRNLMLPLQ